MKGGKLEAAAPWLVTLALLVVWQAICSVFDVSAAAFTVPAPTPARLAVQAADSNASGTRVMAFWALPNR